MGIPDWIEESWRIASDTQLKVLGSLIAITILWTLRYLMTRIVFAKCKDIDFAYPTQRIYYNLQEGKTGAIKTPNYPGK
jgi:hypothetical protein